MTQALAIAQSSKGAAPKVDPVDAALKKAAPAAVAYLDRLVNDENAGTRARAEAARSILDRSGYGAQSRPAAPPAKQTKDLSDMTAGELRETLEAIRVQLSNRATVIDHEPGEPSSAPSDDEMTEMLG